MKKKTEKERKRRWHKGMNRKKTITGRKRNQQRGIEIDRRKVRERKKEEKTDTKGESEIKRE